MSIVGTLTPIFQKTTSARRLSWRYRAVDQWVERQGARFAALGRQVPAGAGVGGVAPRHAGEADVSGLGFGDRPAAPGERTAAHGARHSKKLSSAVARLRGGRIDLVLPSATGGSGCQHIGGTAPVKKNVVHGLL